MKNSNWNTTVFHVEIAPHLLLQGTGEDDNVAVPSDYPRTMANCKHLSVKRLVKKGMYAPSNDGGNGKLHLFGLKEIVRRAHVNEGMSSESNLHQRIKNSWCFHHFFVSLFGCFCTLPKFLVQGVFNSAAASKSEPLTPPSPSNSSTCHSPSASNSHLTAELDLFQQTKTFFWV